MMQAIANQLGATLEPVKGNQIVFSDGSRFNKYGECFSPSGFFGETAYKSGMVVNAVISFLAIERGVSNPAVAVWGDAGRVKVQKPSGVVIHRATRYIDNLLALPKIK